MFTEEYDNSAMAQSENQDILVQNLSSVDIENLKLFDALRSYDEQLTAGTPKISVKNIAFDAGIDKGILYRYSH